MLKTAKGQTEKQTTNIDKTVNSSASSVASRLAEMNKALVEQKDTVDGLSEDIQRLDTKVDALGETVEDNNKLLKENSASLDSIASAATAASAALTTLTVGLGFWETFDAFTVQEAAENRLRAAIKANGEQVEETFQSYAKFTSELQGLTTTGDEASLVLAQQAKSMGLTNEQTKRAVKNAVAMADAFDKSTTQTIMMTAALEQGNSAMISRYLPALREIEDEAERAAEAQRILSDMFEVSKERAQTAAGAMQQLNNSWGDFKEIIGSTVAEVLLPFVKILKDISDEIQKLPKWMQKALAGTIILTAGVAGLTTALIAGKAAIAALGVTLTATTIKVTALSVATKLLQGALIVGLVYAAKEAYDSLSGLNEATDKLNRGLEESASLNQRWADRFTKATNDAIEQANKLEDPAKKRDFLKKEIDTANKELEGYVRNLASTEKQLEEVNTRYNRWFAEEAIEAANADLDDHKSKLELARNRVQSLRDAYKDLDEVTDTAFAEEKVNTYIQSLRQQRLELTKTREELAKIELVAAGATDKMLELVNAELKINRVVEDNVKFQQELDTQLNSITDTIRGLEAEIRGLSNIEFVQESNIQRLKDLQKQLNEARIIKEQAERIAAIPGVTVANIQQIKELYEQLSFTLNPLVQKQTEINKNIERLKALSEFNKMVKEGAALMKKHEDPFDAYVKNANRLNDMLLKGTITMEVYRKEVDSLYENLKKLTEQHRKYVNEFQRIVGVRANTLEGSLRADELKEQMRIVKQQFLDRNADNIEFNRRLDEATNRFNKNKGNIFDNAFKHMIEQIKMNPNNPIGINANQPNDMKLVNNTQVIANNQADSNILLTQIRDLLSTIQQQDTSIINVRL